MSIEYKGEEKVIKLSDTISLKLVSCSEEYTFWDEVYVISNGNCTSIGDYFTDNVAGTHDYIEYNSKCVIFYKGGIEYCYVDRIFDIDTMQFVSLSRNEVKELYGILIPDEIEMPRTGISKTLVNKEN